MNWFLNKNINPVGHNFSWIIAFSILRRMCEEKSWNGVVHGVSKQRSLADVWLWDATEAHFFFKGNFNVIQFVLVTNSSAESAAISVNCEWQKISSWFYTYQWMYSTGSIQREAFPTQDSLVLDPDIQRGHHRKLWQFGDLIENFFITFYSGKDSVQLVLTSAILWPCLLLPSLSHLKSYFLGKQIWRNKNTWLERQWPLSYALINSLFPKFAIDFLLMLFFFYTAYQSIRAWEYILQHSFNGQWFRCLLYKRKDTFSKKVHGGAELIQRDREEARESTYISFITNAWSVVAMVTVHSLVNTHYYF